MKADGDVHVRIPGSVAEAMDLPAEQLQEEMRRELALALYAQDRLSGGQARELWRAWTGVRSYSCWASGRFRVIAEKKNWKRICTMPRYGPRDGCAGRLASRKGGRSGGKRGVVAEESA